MYYTIRKTVTAVCSGLPFTRPLIHGKKLKGNIINEYEPPNVERGDVLFDMAL